MAILFEYHNTTSIENPQALKGYLHVIWQEKYVESIQDLAEESEMQNELSVYKSYQPFFSFDGNVIRAKNYIGFIQFEELHLEIYPKVFKNSEIKPELMLRHLFFWFDYCRRWKLPFTKSNLDSFDNISLP